MLSPGVRIVRGPDWSWRDQDGGEGNVGTVCEIGKSGTVGSPDKTVVVQWDNGTRTNYRVGYLGKFDLRVIDNAQIGVKHPNIGCDGCPSQGICGMRYKCSICYDFDLCYMCYHADKHDLTHSFKRFDSATTLGFLGQNLTPPQKQQAFDIQDSLNPEFVPLVMALTTKSSPFPNYLFSAQFETTNPMIWWKSVAIPESEWSKKDFFLQTAIDCLFTEWKRKRKQELCCTVTEKLGDSNSTLQIEVESWSLLSREKIVDQGAKRRGRLFLETLFDNFSPRIDLPPRLNGRKCELGGIFVGAKVVRGFNWEWGNQDGGEGKVGQVLDIRGWDNESSRSVANVQWLSGSTNVYRLGHKGNCDIKFVESASGGTYYPEHLPALGQNIEAPLVKPLRSGPPPFSVGDKVQVCVSVEQLKLKQQGHGGWNSRMAEYIEKVGTVHRVTDKGDIRVQYEGCNNRWTFNPITLHKVNSFAVGDVVSLITDVEKVKELQKGHGEWIEIMRSSLGKLGKVLKVYSDGDLRVQLDGHAWTLNPQCLRIIPGSAAELANTMHATQNQRLEPSIQWSMANQPDNHNNGGADQFVRAAAQGHLESVQKLLETMPRNAVDMRSSGKTALQVAAHQGHAAIVQLLLRAGASVNAQDVEGDTCLHYAAFGNQPEVLDLLIKSDADLNAANRQGCTALHIAAHKQPARCIQLLLAAAANPNCTDLYGDTPLHDAIGKDSFQVIEMLCQTPGTDFTLRNKRGFNVLHHAALKGKNFATKRLLAQARQLVDVKKDDGFSALHLAALNGHKDVVETLVRVGQADIDLKNNRNQSALLLAVSQGHCGVIELLIRLKANLNAKDEDEDTALHIVLIKRNHFRTEIVPEDCPSIHTLYESISQVTEHKLAISIACYLVQQGIDLDVLNGKNQSALSLLQDSSLQELIKSYKPTLENNQMEQITQEPLANLEGLNLNDRGGYNLNTSILSDNNTTRNSSAKNEEVKNTKRSRGKIDNKPLDIGSTSQENSPNHKNPHYQSEITVSSKPVECLVCSELSEENVHLEPCNHKPACEDCSSRMKKCLKCGILVQKRITKDGRVIPAKSRQPSAERMRYLECKIAEIEESHACSICMERKRNVVFLCGHGTCAKCADTLKTCHMCRKTITKKIPIY